jgi:hypothetical protein
MNRLRVAQTAGLLYRRPLVGGGANFTAPVMSIRMKSETRNPKSERNPNAENRKAIAALKASPMTSDFGFRASGFFRISDFGFRIFPHA